VKLRVRTVDVHLAVPFEIARGVRTEKRVVIVEGDDGVIVARGEASADPYFGESTEALEAAVRSAATLLPEDPLDLATLRARLAERFPHGGAAACAIDILAHDRAAQDAGLPLRTFLGLAPGEAPPTSFTIGIAPPAVMAERAAAAAAAGFHILKVKLGQGDDVATLSAIRERFGGTIRVDPNAAWTPDEAPGRIARIVRFGIEVRGAAGGRGRYRRAAIGPGAFGAADRRRRGRGAVRGYRPAGRGLRRDQRASFRSAAASPRPGR